MWKKELLKRIEELEAKLEDAETRILLLEGNAATIPYTPYIPPQPYTPPPPVIPYTPWPNVPWEPYPAMPYPSPNWWDNGITIS